MEFMKITGYSDPEYLTPLKTIPYTVMINPESIDSKKVMGFNRQLNPDQTLPNSHIEFNHLLSFNLVIDCTGIVDAARTDMAAEMTALEKTLYTKKGNKQEPSFVKVNWGENLYFEGQVLTFDVNYTLFRPNGNPLRAKISLSFGG
ncbi:hypothetical protein [Roseivirga sp. E12]|uniref:CIS tube protein n=1 Tax=Roseivirga sp. E12 TaxID=2819237 RepID=UPI001ABC610D|nr:hypothetical protein [Roseivirga sp. E12]MBO3697748.1 hypothetical protein [Roseivirga sp. E12]